MMIWCCWEFTVSEKKKEKKEVAVHHQMEDTKSDVSYIHITHFVIISVLHFFFQLLKQSNTYFAFFIWADIIYRINDCHSLSSFSFLFCDLFLFFSLYHIFSFHPHFLFFYNFFKYFYFSFILIFCV